MWTIGERSPGHSRNLQKIRFFSYSLLLYVNRFIRFIKMLLTPSLLHELTFPLVHAGSLFLKNLSPAFCLASLAPLTKNESQPGFLPSLFSTPY